jgi:FtsP/CotA-like multicopper oxidase with cupredoxin domain
MYRLFASLAMAMLSVIFSPLAFAQTIDQNAPTNNTNMAGFGQGYLAQSFQQASSNIVGAGIFLNSGVGTGDTVTISLYDNLPNVNGSLLASASTTGTAGAWVDVFWNSVSIAADTTYYLVFSGNTTLGISGDTSNGYSRGNVFANSGYQSFSDYDYTFRTYSGTVSAVPEAETYAMMLAGLGLMGAVARRRKAKQSA